MEKMSYSGGVGVVDAVAARTGIGRALATGRVAGTDDRGRESVRWQ